MKYRIRENPKSEFRIPKSGSTLTEVLMSILALGIGITMVATLFPTSILRGINATRLTRGTIHRYNAEAWIDVFTDQLVHNPDLSNEDLNGNGILDAGEDTNGNGVLDTPRKHYNPSHPGYGTLSYNNYIVDPIGWEIIRRDTDVATANRFGALTGAFGQTGQGSLPRYNGLNNRTPLNAAQFAVAQQVAMSPDSWVEPLKGEFTVTATSAVAPSGGTATITGPSMGDLQSLSDQLGGTEPPEMRIVLLDADGKFSHARKVTGIDPATGVFTWTAGGALPTTGFTATTARIQTQERQFTWMLTVRNRSEVNGATPAEDIKKANVDVVVFFRRQYSAGTNGHENTAWTLMPAGVVGRPRDYIVQAPGGGPLSSPRPFLKKGAWLCDTINARWYRIQRIQNETSNSPTITIETEPPAGEMLTKGVILPTVVEVYSLGTKQ